jgi:hypothetical protein
MASAAQAPTLAQWKAPEHASEYISDMALIRTPPNGSARWLITSAAADPTPHVQIWDLADGGLLGQLPRTAEDGVWALAGYTATGEGEPRAAILSEQGVLELWSVDGKEQLASVDLALDTRSHKIFDLHDASVPCVLPFDDETRLLVGHPLGLRVVDPETGHMILRFDFPRGEGGAGLISDLALVAQEGRVATAHNDGKVGR